MERETRDISLPSGSSVKIKTYLTGREGNVIREDMARMMKFNPKTGEVETDISASFMAEQEKKLLSTIIVSIDGSGDNVLERILDLKDEEYRTIVKSVNEIYHGNLAVAK